ncbi:MBL fold metallo-hydrolase [Flavobacteriaceae bacterium]|nr:MBL fold metallo-hydrolase [Flavobacteriaceae bacterium]
MKYLLSKLLMVAMMFVATGCSAASYVHMIDVNQDGDGGHGDAYLIRSGGKNCLVDAGQYQQAKINLVPRLQALGISRLDCFINTHPHADHLQGLKALAEANIRIDTYYHNRPPLSVDDWAYIHAEHDELVGAHIAQGMKMVRLAAGDSVDFGNGVINVIFAHTELKIKGRTTNVNNFSMVFVFEVDGVRTMFTGDVEVAGGDLVAELPQSKAHIFTTPHHGGLGGSKKLYLGVEAMVHLYSSTKEIFNLLSSEPIGWTNQAGAKLCHNGYNGEIIVKLMDGRFQIIPQNPSANCPSVQMDAPDMKVPPMKKNLAFLTSIYFLLGVGPFDTPPDHSVQIPGTEIEPADGGENE